ncbi:hypothetical protein BU23DRAFT_598665 [Bimuria novae-zelandiae CBS 107.79]|uniref:Uncharacterized protein n=1 Tax=Bimuria novae-zelandiae CBS 107.79 TaxID=1447943 RepID=A0A6A5V978_9PLEO|nr:hypothetical protein BU23DRAFT_598665 [Bimuria novae-zelandiae CBS 107.79]
MEAFYLVRDFVPGEGDGRNGCGSQQSVEGEGEEMKRGGARGGGGKKGVFVLLGKHDLLAEGEREKRVEEIGGMFEERLGAFRERGVHVEVLKTLGLDVRRGKDVDAVLRRIKAVVAPTPTTPTTRNKKAAHEKEHEKEKEKEREREKPTYVATENPSLPPPTPAPPTTRDHLQLISSSTASAEPNDDAFWTSFFTASIPTWDHYTHLRAGYFTLLPYLTNPSTPHPILPAANDFLTHLSRLRSSRPEKFGNTAHKTMTVFWLAQLLSAARAFDEGRGLLTRGAFADVLVKSPWLMDGGLWKGYYSRERMFSKEARQGWRTPDLKTLPVEVSGDDLDKGAREASSKRRLFF